MAVSERISQLMGALDPTSGPNSGATSPGGNWRDADGSGTDDERDSRSRPRTFPYFEYLPYQTEGDGERDASLETCLKHLYIAVSAGDFAPGAVHWTREIRGWLQLKFDLPRSTRVKLVNLYYELALAPGLDYLVAERFASMFMVLTKRKHYLRPGKDQVILDWRPLYRELKLFVLPSESGGSHPPNVKRNIRTLTKMCTFAQLYFDPKEIPAIFEELLPFFSTSFSEGAFVVVGLLNLLLPTHPPPEDRPDLLPQEYLPTFFHLWSLVNRSRLFDAHFIDTMSRLARDNLTASHIPFSQYGLFTAEQSSQIFTAILRLLEIPVGQATSPYSSTVDLGAGLAVMLDRDVRKHPSTHHIARIIAMSLSPACTDNSESVLSKLEGLIQAVETFFHPSNSGSWTRPLAQLVYYLADFFVLRWNREHSGEMDVPKDRQLNDAVKRRFVLCLREVTFMGIFSKSDKAVQYALSTLQSLAYLEPNLILPGALQRIYPAMQGLVEVHRTISSIRALHMLSKIMAKTKGFRCHVTTALGLALPGIDPNDLEKTLHTLQYVQGVCYLVPFHDLTKAKKAADRESTNGVSTPADDIGGDTGLAVQWITEQVERLESANGNIEIDYDKELSDEDEQMILRSSTSGLNEFLISFIGRVFTLLENLPDAARVRSGSPEEYVVNHLPAAFTPLLAALSPELYDVALDKIANFITNHVIHQARDAIAFICNSLVKINPQKALKRILPHLFAGIRTEIDEIGAGSTRTTGAEVLPRDRALVWNLSILSMCVVHVGDAVLPWKDELFEIAEYMQLKCRGTPTVHVSNFIHHLLLNLTCTYTVDYSIYEDDEVEKGLTTESWGRQLDVKKLNIKWHSPNSEEIDFAVKLFETHASNSMNALVALIQSDPPIKREGTGKDWSDEVSRNLVLLRLILSGVSVLFDGRHDQSGEGSTADSNDGSDPDAMDTEGIDDDAGLGEAEDEEVKPTFQYESGYPLRRDDKNYKLMHDLRHRVGEILHDVHQFLIEKQPDDVPCFNSLYNAYRSWFIDVGIEKSAHVLDRISRLLDNDEQPFRFSGLRKQYPRPLLVRRANVYHLQRLRHNAAPRPKTDLDKQLFLDLAESSISLYTEIRRTAQTANESAIKCVLGARPLVIPPLLDAFVKAVAESDYPRIKGAMFALLYGSLAKTISRDWRFTPKLIKAFIEVTGADKPSVQKLATNATFQVMDMGKAMERMVILDKTVVEAIAYAMDTSEEEVQQKVTKRQDFIKRKRARIEGKKAELSKELVEIANTEHWKKVSRTAAIIVNLGMRYDTIASDEMIDLIARGTIDQHPSLRGLYAGALIGLYSVIQTRAITGHSYQKYLLGEEDLPDKISVPTRPDDPNWTEEHLESFAQPEAKYYVDFDYPGWLVWNKTMPAFLPNAVQLSYDDVENDVRRKIAKHLTRSWFSNYFAFMKQEPRDTSADRFRMSSAMLLTHSFDLVFCGVTETTFEDIKDLTQSVYGDGSDKHQHRATSEIMAALLSCAPDLHPDQRQEVWEYVFPIVRGIFKDGLTPENNGYWTTFLHVVLQSKDPRRSWPLVDWLASLRLDMDSNAAFKESSKIHLLTQAISDVGWHFRREEPILDDFLSHLDHPYKGVREAMGQTIASIYRTRYHESYKDVDSLVKAQKEASSIGVRPYEPTEEFSKVITDVFDRLEVWRQQRPSGQQTPSSYTSGGKTVLLWLDSTLSSYECTQLVKFFPNVFMEQLLHMMDIKEDPELQSLAYHVFRHLPNIPHREGEDAEFIAALIRIGRNATSWHQRLRILINIQVIYFRRLFLMGEKQQQTMFDCVSAMLSDVQLEVRMGAATTLSGMIRCSPVALRDVQVSTLKKRFTTQLAKSPLPKRRNPGTPTVEQGKVVLTRHAAVLGLGALVQAFPYQSPPPTWLPEVLATLARKAAADPGMVGKSVKSVLADFKKTRQDTWHVDVKAFEQEQLEDLEGGAPPHSHRHDQPTTAPSVANNFTGRRDLDKARRRLCHRRRKWSLALLMPAYFFHITFELYPSRSSPDSTFSPPPGTDIFGAELPVHRREQRGEWGFFGPSKSSTWKTGAPSSTRDRRPAARRFSQRTRRSFSDHHDSPVPVGKPATRTGGSQRESAGQRDWRFDSIAIASIDMDAPSLAPNAGGLATKGRFIAADIKDTDVGWGVVHLYRDGHETPGLYEQPDGVRGLDAQPDAAPSDAECTTLCILAVPAYMTPSDFLGFMGEQTREDVSHFRLIRTSRANKYMVLIKFGDAHKARAWQREWNGKPFNSMEPEYCHVVFVKSITFANGDSTTDPSSYPDLTNDPFAPAPTKQPVSAVDAPSLTAKPHAPPTPALVELPTCPVCLERMDETTGLLTILCQHVFHCACLEKWRGSGCPVCRYTQNDAFGSHRALDGDAPDNECSVCAATENLWICLVCGNTGCGRYDEAHAFAHYEATSHTYAMDVATQHVWDYAGDGYVHRLIQNKADGKLVDLPASTHQSFGAPGMTGYANDTVPREKLDNMGMEYAYLLTSQLESQRAYFEEQLERAVDKAAKASSSADEAARTLASFNQKIEALTLQHADAQKQISALEKDGARNAQKATSASDLARKLTKQYKEEQTINESLMSRIKHLENKTVEAEARAREMEAQKVDLEEQNRDLSFFISGQEKLREMQGNEVFGLGEGEVEGGTVEIGDKGRKRKGKKKA
ncbi:hypothetical protein P153DRAFT_356052 [Dothidotthia symphoricarpi CBS 119687]|uniref:Proteasome activator subunit 4 n=1 Tax=Dothidotthia symphoricarpi CBS 119687 TaxID=1392245 RepID=A0A6A6AEK8_9PLEO|nr:uncharacterized protein P153DRAFT_356052 [Dothidotthia symphoricarpi CBS 119687]KAF2130250.1 hypothetical protein P153DRAFT_356052 [Dothidotthia symphoricarpi CBS 119687]